MKLGERPVVLITSSDLNGPHLTSSDRIVRGSFHKRRHSNSS